MGGAGGNGESTKITGEGPGGKGEEGPGTGRVESEVRLEHG